MILPDETDIFDPSEDEKPIPLVLSRAKLGQRKRSGSRSFLMGVWSYSLCRMVTWRVPGHPDPTGIHFPGPGVFGVDTQPLAHIEGYNVK